MSKKPNIILFITHDQGQLIGCYNSPRMPNSLNTPNLDDLAAKGVRFESNFCTAPQCSPSRGSIQTSLYPHQNGLMGLVNRGWTLPTTNKTLPMYLKENGYTTHLIGIQHESKKPSTLGYENIMQFDKISDFFLEHNNDKDPFYVCIGTYAVHIPFRQFGVPVDPANVQVPPFLPDHTTVREDLSELYGSIHYVDDLIGEIINLLEKYDLHNNTLFIFTTDHGPALPRAKCTLYDPGIKTSLIMSLPSSELFSSGKVITSMINNIDLLPSILELIDGNIPNNIEGKSFLPILEEKQTSNRSEIFVEKSWHDDYDPMRGIRTEKFKYIRNFEKLDTSFKMPLDIANIRSGKAVNETMKEIYTTPRLKEELYDLEKDPNEKSNLFHDPAYKNIAEQLRTKLNEWMERTNDPILNGKIEHPKIARKKGTK
ncbi:MAG: sulfatase [Promethearchaeota archaeon]